jgi:hypothetical protein
MSEETLRNELYAANENRAVVLYLIYDEMRREFGAERAAEVMKRAVLRRGRQLAERLKPYAPDDFQGLCDAFVGAIPDQGRMFDPTVLRCDDQGVDIEFRACPLKDAWRTMGLPDEECAAICDIASMVDYGTFQAAGFDFSLKALPHGEKDRCVLSIRKKE